MDKPEQELRQLKAKLRLLIFRWMGEAGDIRTDPNPNPETKSLNEAVAHTNEQHSAEIAAILK